MLKSDQRRDAHTVQQEQPELQAAPQPQVEHEQSPIVVVGRGGGKMDGFDRAYIRLEVESLLSLDDARNRRLSRRRGKEELEGGAGPLYIFISPTTLRQRYGNGRSPCDGPAGVLHTLTWMGTLMATNEKVKI